MWMLRCSRWLLAPCYVVTKVPNSKTYQVLSFSINLWDFFIGFFFPTPDEKQTNKESKRYPGHSGFLCIPGCSSTFRSHSRRWRCSYIHTAADSHSQTSREDTLYKTHTPTQLTKHPEPTACKTNTQTHVVIDCLGWWMRSTVTHTQIIIRAAKRLFRIDILTTP